MVKPGKAKSIPDDEQWGDEVEGTMGGALVQFPDDEEVVLVGVVTGVEEVKSKFKDDDGNLKTQRRYNITVDGGEKKQFFAPAMLDSKLRTVEGDLGFPARVRIVSSGDYVKPEGAKRPMKEFSVKSKPVER